MTTTTLAQARAALSPYTQNGQCSDNAEVRIKINEAGSRIHAMGDWLGLIKRYGVSVDQATGEFNVPESAESVIRFSELAPGLSHSETGTIITDDAYAFVFDYPSMTKFRQVSPRRFKILGPYPTAVDVMAKVKFSDAVLESDVLVVGDLNALKLMLLALFNEENNGFELAAAQIAKCQEYLTTKTRLAVDAARKTQYESILSAAAYGTRGHARAKLALKLTGGTRQDDHMICELLDEAESRIMSLTQFWESYLLKTNSGILSLPPEIESILMADFNNCPTTLNGPYAEFTHAGIGYREATYGARKNAAVIYRGRYALHTDLSEASTLQFLFYGSNSGVEVFIEGISPEGSYVSERVSLTGGQLVSTQNIYAQVDSISSDPRDGAISVLQGLQEVAYIWPYTQSSEVARYAVPSNEQCTESIIRVIGRAKHVPKVRDEQRMQIDNIDALCLMAGAIYLEQSGEHEKANLLEAKAITLFEQSMRNRHAGNKVLINKDPALSMKIRVGY